MLRKTQDTPNYSVVTYKTVVPNANSVSHEEQLMVVIHYQTG